MFNLHQGFLCFWTKDSLPRYLKEGQMTNCFMFNIKIEKISVLNLTVDIFLLHKRNAIRQNVNIKKEK